MEIVATHKQLTLLTDALHSKGVVTDVEDFDISKYPYASELPHYCQSSVCNFMHWTHCYSIKHVHYIQELKEDIFLPRTMIIQFFVRDKEGALAEALHTFGVSYIPMIILDSLGITVICLVQPCFCIQYQF